jgi:hypothetical protein
LHFISCLDFLLNQFTKKKQNPNMYNALYIPMLRFFKSSYTVFSLFKSLITKSLMKLIVIIYQKKLLEKIIIHTEWYTWRINLKLSYNTMYLFFKFSFCGSIFKLILLFKEYGNLQYVNQWYILMNERGGCWLYRYHTFSTTNKKTLY